MDQSAQKPLPAQPEHKIVCLDCAHFRPVGGSKLVLGECRWDDHVPPWLQEYLDQEGGYYGPDRKIWDGPTAPLMCPVHVALSEPPA